MTSKRRAELVPVQQGFAVAGGEPCDRDLWAMGWTTQARTNVGDVEPRKEMI